MVAGRRPLLFTSLWGVVVSLLVLSASFHLIGRQARSIHANTTATTASVPSAIGPSACSSATSCFDCVDVLDGCGFCMDPSGDAGECVATKTFLGNIR